MSIHFATSLQAFPYPQPQPLPWQTRSGAEGRTPTPLWWLLLLLLPSAPRAGWDRGVPSPQSPARVPGLLPAVPATTGGSRINTGCATQSHSKKAKSSYLMTLICALVRSTEHNYILALKRGKKKKRLYFDVLVFASQQYVLKGNYGNLSFQFPLYTAEKNRNSSCTFAFHF